MSKAGVNSAPIKQEASQFKKDVKNQNNIVQKDDKRQSDSFSGPGGRQPQHVSHHHNRDRSENRNDSNDYNKHAQDMKNADKDDKSSTDPSGGPLTEKKFTGRCRLFIGNLTPDITEDEFRKLFEPYGETSETYVNTSRGFGFVRLDYRHNAEAAKAALDGLHRKGRILRVRFASHGAALKVKNLHPYVSNELLEQSFLQFGELERCVVIVDDRGKPTSEGIVEFVRKPGANSALRRITEGVFLLGAEPKPIVVEPLEQKDEEDGMPEKFLTRTDQYKKEREKEPRFAPPGTFEYEFGMRWKQLEEVEKQRIEQIKKDTEDARLKLEDEMQNALYDYQAEQIRQDLRRQQEELMRLEELRNQDRMRRQQEHDIRRQQDERERAQQEERRRADAMMMMRQHEIARGRGGPMDMPGLRGRDDMMMPDRYGDRMPERIGDRMHDRMPERMGERMPDRIGDRMPDRMGDRMADRMPDRMGERMPDRMGDRMPDRMGDRMGPGQEFMWDEKQRAEANMRGDANRGRGPGAAPLQPPPVPPTGINTADRAENNPASAGAASASAGAPATTAPTQGSKTSPKPLMQATGFSGTGNQPNAGQTPNPSANAAAPDNNPMDEYYSDELIKLGLTDAEEYNHLAKCSDHPQSCDNVDVYVKCSNFKQDECCLCEGKLSTHNHKDNCNICRKSDNVSNNMKTLVETTEMLKDNYQDNVSDTTCDEFNDCKSKHRQTNIANYSTHKNTKSVTECHSDDSTQESSGDELETMTTVDGVGINSKSFSTCSDNDIVHQELKFSTFSLRETESKICDNKNSCRNKSDKCVNKSLEYFSSLKNDFSLDSGINCSDSFETNKSNNSRTEHSNKYVINSVSDCNLIYSEDKYHTFDNVHQAETEDSYLSSDLSQPLDFVNIPQSMSSCDSIHISHRGTDVGDSSFIITGGEHTEKEENISVSHNLPVDSECEQLFKIKLTDHYDDDDNDYRQEIDFSIENNLEELRFCYKQSIDNDMMYKQTSNLDKNLSPYKQHLSGSAEEIDTEDVLVKDNIPYVSSSSPNVYQSYEMDSVSAHYQTSPVADFVNNERNENATSDINSSAWNPAINITNNNTASSNFVTPNQTHNNTNNMATEAVTCSFERQTASTCSSTLSSRSSVTNFEDDHKAVFCTGDQNFKPKVNRQPSVVSYIPAGCSLSYVSGINPSLYTGTAIVQGIGVPTVMTNSAVHIAQHAGGAAIMQHQSMSTGINGALAQATVMQQQAMTNGVKATSVLQHHTLTNRGQTVLVQHCTMTSGQGGLAQQTVVQQQLSAPASIAQTAVFHANAVRCHNQASVMQQRGVRLVPARLICSPMVQSQTVGANIIRGAHVNPAALMGHGYVRSSNGASMMQHIVQQQYLGGPIMAGRGVQIVTGPPIRLVNK